VSLYVDTSAFFAAVDDDEADSGPVRTVLASERRLVTSDHVLVESWLLIHRKLGRSAADGFWASLRAGAASIEQVGPGDLEVAWAIGESWPDQDFSIVDRTSFAVMQRLGVHRVATLDDHFGVFRFGPRRERAFEIVR
jgi:predicted nucleic acid-binding protein